MFTIKDVNPKIVTEHLNPWRFASHCAFFQVNQKHIHYNECQDLSTSTK